MGGFFGVVSRTDCVEDLFYGTDYHSHLGTQRGGLAVWSDSGIQRKIHNITNAQFRSKFDEHIGSMKGRQGIGVISDYESQPLIIRSHLGLYTLVTVGVLTNLEDLANEAFADKSTHFSEISGSEPNPTEVVAALINQGTSFVDGIRLAQERIEGSCSMLLLRGNRLYAARDRLGRTPVIVGEKPGSVALTLETCAFPSLGYETVHELGPGEIVCVEGEGWQTVQPPGDRLQICAFLWVYYGYPASRYEGINVEAARNRCGEALAAREEIEIDIVAGIPDSGTAHGLGYASAAGVPYRRPFVKYTPTWPRSFMPQNQTVRDLVARMKLIPVRDYITGKRLLFCEDSIVRGTQLKDTISRLFDYGAKEVHMRPACPALMYGCKFLNFSRSKSELDLAARRAVRELEGTDPEDLSAYVDPDSDKHHAMIERIGLRLGLTSLRYQRLEDMVAAIGMPKEKVCTYCWDKAE